MDENVNIPASLPLGLSRQEKLKVFAIVAKHNSLPHEIIKEKLTLIVAVAYSPAEAILGSQEIIRQSGLKQEEYFTPYMMVSRDLDQVLQVGMLDESLVSGSKNQSADSGEAVRVNQKKPVGPSVKELLDRVRYVFAEVGTIKEKIIAEAVIQRYKDSMKK